MPVAVKKLHMASSLSELRKQSTVDIVKFKDRSNQKLIESAKKLYQSAISKLQEEEADEELAYVYLFRAMELWDLVTKTPEFISDSKYFQLMYGKDMKTTLESLHEYTVKLEQRYAALKNDTANKSKESLRSQYKLTANVVPKKRKEGKDSVRDKTNVDNTPMTTNHQITDKKCLEDYNLMFNTEIIKSENGYYGEKKFIESDVLKDKIADSFHDILVIDIRPKADFELSKISNVHSVNIPGSSIVNGLSANKLGGLITTEYEKRYWGQRDTYDQLILLDWYSEQKDVIPSSPLSTLHIILTKWDPDCIYKNNPLILNGGFERFLDTYPTFTTNAKIPRPEKPVTSPFIHLSDHNIEYPMNVLEEDSIYPNAKTVSKTNDRNLITPTSRPTIDRSNKPHQLPEKVDKSENTLENINLSERNVSISEKTNQFIHDEKMEEEKVIPSRPSQNKEVPLENSQFKDRPLDKKVSYTPSIPPRLATPPRSEQHQVNPNKGDGDGEIYLEKTKFDTPSRGGLKRSASSPNINKLGDEELDKSSWTPMPMFDRSTKPKHTPSYDYMPRSAGTDTVYLADPNRKSRGLTGLKNLGNLCYMNSIMQCISHTVDLMQELTKFNLKECRGGRQIAIEVSSLLRTLWQGDTRTTSCRNLKMRVGALRHSFSTMEQQDSHEFLTILVDWLHEDLNEPSHTKSLEGAVVATGEKAWGEFRQKNNSVVVDLFYGQLKSTVTCEYCQTQSVLFEPFSNLSIPLPSAQDDKDKTFTLQECLKLYLKDESISGWVCPKCKTARKATKKLDITRLPPVLIIHLKRFMNDMVGVGWCRKRMNMVDFPIVDLNMKPYTHPESELRVHNYNLYAVSNHYGSMESGHYTAYCKNHMLYKWYKFDDQDVNEISPSEVKSSAAYILFYESSQFESQRQRILD